MSETGSDTTRPRTRRRFAKRASGELEELRELLFGQESERLDQIERRLASGRIGAEDVSSVLPRAFALKSGDPELNAAMAPMVEDAIETSVRKNPQPLVDAIFPIIGPAIRRSIREALATMTDGMNQALESSFTARGLRWRLEAWRSGRRYSEIALLKSLVYRVEQIFLVHSETGILLEQVRDPSIRGEDPDLVTSMLAAIQDFVRDSFGSDSEDDAVSQITFGDHVLEVVAGPRASIAAVVRGRTPNRYRTGLQQLLERIHTSSAADLQHFRGDVEPFRAAIPLLELALEREEVERKRGGAAQFLFATLAIAAVLYAAYWIVQEVGRHSVWDRMEQRVRSTPGIVVVSHARQAGRMTLVGFRDPMSEDLEDVVEPFGMAPRHYELNFTPLHSSHPPFVLKRFRSLSAAPAGIGLGVSLDGHLTVTGRATADWIARARTLAELMPNITSADFDGVVIDG